MAHIYDFDAAPDLPLSELTQLLGGKAANLVVMARELGLPVPPGFTITTQACNRYLASGWPAGLDEELREALARLGDRLGRRFGDPADPLLVSVRSGAPVSMPGMMDTILDLGLGDASLPGLAAASGDDAFAADCLRRLRAMYGEIVGEELPSDPWRQLRGAVEAVFGSWNSDRARAYREREGIADDLGTAVTVQAMVFGNRGMDSATGVLFTRNPATGEATPYGDIMFNAQGEDVVAGTHRTEPLSVLDERMPAVGAELARYARALERYHADLCDIEFTIERGGLWMLQARIGKRSPRAALRMAVEMALDPEFPLTKEKAVRRTAGYLADPPRSFVRAEGGATPLISGLPASPGVASGEIATTPEAAEAAAADGRAVILVRTETSPADVRGMARAAGVLTARGGLASHAAVVARGWGIPAVVGAADLAVDDGQVIVAGRSLPAGERITIDGTRGDVFAGDLAGQWEVAPEAETLIGWARELGIEVGTAPAKAAAVGPGTGEAAAAAKREDVLRALLIKGTVPPDQLAVALGCEEAGVEGPIEALGNEGLAEAGDGGRRLTAEGKLAALALFEDDRARIGAKTVAGLLTAFGALDARMKEMVTAWQLRTVDGEQTFNDHTDAAYDTAVIAGLGELHTDAVRWMAPLLESFDRYRAYEVRLERSLTAARDGDARFVASPRVDSYHGVWFELHEDLIRLAGRRRSEEPGQ